MIMMEANMGDDMHTKRAAAFAQVMVDEFCEEYSLSLTPTAELLCEPRDVKEAWYFTAEFTLYGVDFCLTVAVCLNGNTIITGASRSAKWPKELGYWHSTSTGTISSVRKSVQWLLERARDETEDTTASVSSMRRREWEAYSFRQRHNQEQALIDRYLWTMAEKSERAEKDIPND